MTDEKAKEVMDRIGLPEEEQKKFFERTEMARREKKEVTKKEIIDAVSKASTSVFGISAVEDIRHIIVGKLIVDEIFGKEKEDDTV